MAQYTRGESGVTLLLSVLILSAITAVAFSVATIMLVEVRTSADVARTDTAYYNDQGIVEEAIFAFKRKVTTVKDNFGTLVSGQNCSNFASLMQGPSYPSVTNKTRRCLFNAEHIVKETIPVPPSGSNLHPYYNSKKIFLYNPSYLTPGNQPGGYKRITFNNLGTTPLTIYVCRLDIICDPEASTDGFALTLSLNGSGYRDFDNILNPSQSYEIAIQNNGSVEGVLEIGTYGPDKITPKGLPYLNKEGVEIESTRGGLTRRVQVLVPTQ